MKTPKQPNSVRRALPPVPHTLAMSGGNPLETELNTYRTIQSEIGKVQGSISTAQTQILENELVLKVRSDTRRGHAFHPGAAPPRAHPASAVLTGLYLLRTQELELLEEDASIFKLIGPVLVKQELMEVKNNVTKRVEFIKNDMCAVP